MSTKSTMKISVPAQATRLTWTSIEDTPFSAEEIFEIVQRYCDSQDHAKNYRHKAALKVKLLKARMEQIELLASKSGMSVEEYLESEADNLKDSE